MDPIFLAIILYFVAILLAAIDVFVPSGGILLILGIIAGVASIYCGFQAGLTAGLIMATVVVGTIPVFFVVAIKIWPRTPLGKRILLKPPEIPTESGKPSLENFIGTVVVNRWPLMPMGQLQIGRQKFNAVSADGTLIDPEQKVKVVAVRDSLLVVSPTEEPVSENLDASSKADPADRQNAPESDEALLNRPAEELGLDQLEDLPLNRDDL